MMLSLAMNNIAKIQDTIVSKPKISNCCSMSNIENKTNDYDDYEVDSNEIRNKTFLPEPLPKRPEYNTNTNTHGNQIQTSIDSKFLNTLKTLDLENLYCLFIDNGINFNDLFLLTKEDLIEMEIAIGPRNRLLHFADEYKKIAKEYDTKEIIEFFSNNKCLAINQIDYDWTISQENKQLSFNRNIRNSNHTNNEDYNNIYIDKRQIRHNSARKQPNESYQSINNISEDIKDSISNSNQNNVSCSNRRKNNKEDLNKYLNNKNTKLKEHYIINGLISNIYNNKKQLQQATLQSNSRFNTNINTNVTTNIYPKSNNSFSHYVNQCYETRSDSYRKQENQQIIRPIEATKTNNGTIVKGKQNQLQNENNKTIPKQNYAIPNQSTIKLSKHSHFHHSSMTALHQNNVTNEPLTFANNEETKKIKLNFDHKDNDDDLESIIFSEDKTSNRNKESYSTNATLKQVIIPKPKNKSHLLENANGIFAEVESFQHQYETMKQNNNQRKNKLNMLLKKKETNENHKQVNSSGYNANLNYNSNVNHCQSKSVLFNQTNYNNPININRNSLYNIEFERNLNEELLKRECNYKNKDNKTRINSYNYNKKNNNILGNNY